MFRVINFPKTTIPLVNPYEYFAKNPSAFSIKGVRDLIKASSSREVMEYVQSSKFSSCQVPASSGPSQKGTIADYSASKIQSLRYMDDWAVSIKK
ncbi:hypothetical protein F2Q69_00036941 [Brassica cretica]|uniref:Uncharacterized protein n=1 Tax=Brassica cretica TaxID=69181 RepID=A0A8S9SMS7_BRACR|nr:hypothetical protein F2Q69_00036941 [Brassica cretica]